jgi:amidase
MPDDTARPVDSNDLAWADATAQAELVRRGEASPLELVSAAIARIERLDPRLNAVIHRMFDRARRAASGPLPDGPFRGVPFLVKDILAAVEGEPLASGSVSMRDYVAPGDSWLVDRYRKAGLVIVGKTSTPEFGFLPTTEPRLHGATRNPWDLTRTTGGSSGGSAAAVASGMVPFAHANDGGGSIRIPASCCGLFGLKPTRGRTTLGPALGDVMGGLVCEHALTRSVRDSAALLDAVHGPGPGDPYFAPPPARPFLAEVGADPGRLRVAFSTATLSGAAAHPDCVAAVADAARLCEQLGHHVEEASPPVDAAMFTMMFTAVWAAGAGAALDGLSFLTGRPITPGLVEPLSWALAEMGRATPAPRYLMATAYLQQLSRAVARFMLRHDVLLTPVLAEPPLPLGSFEPTADNPLAALARAASFAPFTPLQNVTGEPAMSVPLHWNAQGLPIGVQFVARCGDEATLFRLGAQLEQARPWAHRRPAPAL